MAHFGPLSVLAMLMASGCSGGPDLNEAARQALQDGRASLAALGAPTPQPAPPREPARLRPLRTDGLPAAGEPRIQAAMPSHLPANAAGLSGSAPERILEWLGEPVLRRAEGPVSIWLYAGAGCQLDVMFYPAAEGPRVAYVQARAGGFAQRTEAACLRDLAAQARRTPRAAPLPGDTSGANPTELLG